MAKITIPETFRLLNTTWTVRQDKDAELHEVADAFGMCFLSKQELWVKSTLVPEMKRQVFYHELAHALLEMSNQNDLSKDEAVIELLGTMLCQYHDTKRGSLQ